MMDHNLLNETEVHPAVNEHMNKQVEQRETSLLQNAN